LIMKVPVGTFVRRQPEGELLADLIEHGQRLLVAKGGSGGRGNTGGLATTRVREIDDDRLLGVEGEEVRIDLELKTLADVGLLGIPNAGKSSLLRSVSNAHPKIAPYPFTTINPHLGVIDFDDYWRMRMADVPGIVSGAHRDVGLGLDFLRHIERCNVLVYVIDLRCGVGKGWW